MPYGKQELGKVDAPAGPRPATLDYAEPVPPAEQPLTEQLAAGERDLFAHYTIEPGALASGAVADLRPGRPFTAYQLVVIESVQLIVGLDDEPSEDDYDAVHPGLAEVTRICPEARALHVAARSDPAENVEVYLYAGRHALRINA